jgi:hypothetical protein
MFDLARVLLNELIAKCETNVVHGASLERIIDRENGPCGLTVFHSAR